jgi:hypothetical protein
VTYTNEIQELKAKKAEMDAAGESTEEIDAEIKSLETLRDTWDTRWRTSAVTLLINNKNILMAPNKVYRLDNIDEEISSI